MWNEDYKEMLQIFLRGNVDFLLVGAYAMAAHGFPRATLDIDIWVSPNPGNARRVFNSLAEFGAPMSQVSVTDFEVNDTIFQIGVAPRRIDILTAISGVKFEDAMSRAVEAEVDGMVIKIISVADLYRNKIASGRPKDIVDAETLKNQIAQ